MTEAKLKKSKLGLFTLCFVIYSYTATAAFGIEDMVAWGGPGITFLALVIVPFIWAIPMALASAELTSMYPENGGLYVWTTKAMGEFAGFLSGWWYFLCSIVSTAVFLALMISYIGDLLGGTGVYQGLLGAFSGLTGSEDGGATVMRILIGAIIVLFIAWINIKGVGAVGSSNVLFVIIALAPFVIATVLGLFQIQYNPFESFSMPEAAEGEAMGAGAFTSYGLIIAMWMYCGYEAIGSVAEEIDGAYHLIPKGIFICLPIAAAIYIIPTMVGAAVAGNWGSWGAEAGEGVITFVEMGRIIGGNALMIAFLISALFASLAMYNAYILSTSRFPFVMARDNLFFKFFAKISPKYGTPAIAILITSLINIFLSTQHFDTLIVMAMTLYFIPVLLFMFSVLILRYTAPNAPRPYKIPGGKGFLTILVILPTLVVGVAFWNMTEFELVSGAIGLATGPVAYAFFKWRYGGRSKEEIAAAHHEAG